MILFAQVRAQRLSVFSLNPGEKTAMGDLKTASCELHLPLCGIRQSSGSECWSSAESGEMGSSFTHFAGEEKVESWSFSELAGESSTS